MTHSGESTPAWSARHEWPMWLLLALMFAVAAITWPDLPDRLPTHWNLKGEVDGWGGKFAGILLLPILTTGLYLLLLFVPRLDPGRANYSQFEGPYRLFRIGFVLFMALLYGGMQRAFHGHAMNMTTFLTPLMGAFFILIGNLMGKLRPNWFIGIRTPWTLSSKQSWVRTHRLGGWVFVISGIAFVAAGFLRTDWAQVAAMVLMLGGVLVTVVYSYVIWKDDPDKTPPAGTTPAG